MEAINPNLTSENFPSVSAVKLLENRFQGFALKRGLWDCLSHRNFNAPQQEQLKKPQVLCAHRLIVPWPD